MKFNRLQHLISASQTQTAVTFWATKFVAPNPRQFKMVASGVLVLVNPVLRTVIAEVKVNVVNIKDVPRLAVMHVIQILTVVRIPICTNCIVVSIRIPPMTMCVDIAVSERLAIAIQTVADRTNFVPPVKYVGNLDLIVRKTLTARGMERVVKLANVLINALALRVMTASWESVANIASVVQAVPDIIARLIAIVEGRPTVVNVET